MISLLLSFSWQSTKRNSSDNVITLKHDDVFYEAIPML
jgi:hypothetical protein